MKRNLLKPKTKNVETSLNDITTSKTTDKINKTINVETY